MYAEVVGRIQDKQNVHYTVQFIFFKYKNYPQANIFYIMFPHYGQTKFALPISSISFETLIKNVFKSTAVVLTHVHDEATFVDWLTANQ